MTLYAPAILRPELLALDKLSPTLHYAKRAIIVDSRGDFLGFAQYRLFDSYGPRNFHFEPKMKMTAAGLRVPDIPGHIAWLDGGPIKLYPDDQMNIALRIDGRLY